MTRLLALSAAVLAASAVACSSDDTENHGEPVEPSSGGSPADGSGGADSEGTGGTDAEGAGGSKSEGNGCGVASASKPCSDDPDPCGLNSGFEGDEFCILPPPEGKGIQIHFGPKDYKNAAEIAKYILEPSEEFNAYGIANIPTTEDNYYNYVQIRMRPGSHHLINTVVTGDLEEGFTDGMSGCPGTRVGGFTGTQNLIRDAPPNGQQAPENVGLGSKLVGNAKLCLNHHAYNYGDKPQLREVWINVWFVDESEVTQKTESVIITAGPWQGIPPHTQKVLTSQAVVEGEGRIINLFGHRHAWTDRFAVWHNEELIYDSWDWQESVVFEYNSITQNPPPDPAQKTDGAVSGVRPVHVGDKIDIECDIDNQSENTLTFRNELYTGEMCILFGSSVGTDIGGLPIPGGGS